LDSNEIAPDSILIASLEGWAELGYKCFVFVVLGCPRVILKMPAWGIEFDLWWLLFDLGFRMCDVRRFVLSVKVISVISLGTMSSQVSDRSASSWAAGLSCWVEAGFLSKRSL
jgi:hypothetical protein